MIRNEIIRMSSGPGARQQPQSTDPEIEEIRMQKEAAIEAGDFQRAANLRDAERQLVTLRTKLHSQTFRNKTHRTSRCRVWAEWSSMLTGAALLGLGILIARLVWG
jgi:hypothetical protein